LASLGFSRAIARLAASRYPEAWRTISSAAQVRHPTFVRSPNWSAALRAEGAPVAPRPTRQRPASPRQVEGGRALGLTLKEIQEVCDAYLAGAGPIAVLFREKLAAARARVEQRMAELEAQRARIAEVDARLAAAIAAGQEDVLLEPDPRRPVAV
jgi:hypothetical protein